MKISAGIVTYNPNLERLEKNIKSIIEQVDYIIIVDNHSKNINEIEELIKNFEKCEIIKNQENCGIALALNQIMRKSNSVNSVWTLTLDQDTVCLPILMEKYKEIIFEQNVGMITGLYKDMNIDNIKKDNFTSFNYDEIKFCITSASLINNKCWEKIGGFDDFMFIDKVDNDICHKIINAGYRILRVNKICFYHEVGNAKEINFFGKKCFVYNHGAFRRYYIVRNTIYLSRKYKEVKFFNSIMHIFFYTLIVLLYEKDKLKKMSATLKGMIDGLFCKIQRSDNTKEKINIIIPSIGLSGGVKVVLKYSELFIERGYDVKIYVPIKAYNLHKDNWLKNKITVFRNTLGKIYHLLLKKDHYKIISEKIITPVIKVNNKTIRNADICIATAWPTAYDVKELNLLKGEKIYFVQDYEIWDNVELVKATYHFEMKKIVISNWINEQLELQGTSTGVVIHNGIDLKDFYNNGNYKKNDKQIKCLMLYHDLEKKGVKDGIKAFENAKKVCPNLELTLFGMNRPEKISDKYRFINNPKKEELRNLYCESDIFIFPSKVEGWGLTPIEAMACKCPVAGTRTGCLIDLGKNNINALISEPEDIEALGNSIIRLAQNKLLREKIAEEGYITIKELNWDMAADKFISFFRRKL